MTDLYLKHIALRQFRSFATLDVELPAQPGVLVVHGSNGLGKSSLFDALEWALSDSIDHFRDANGVNKPGTYLCRWRDGEPGPTSATMTFSDDSTIARSLLSANSTASKLEGNVPNITEFLRAPTWQQSISDLRRYLLLTHFLGQSTVSRLTHRKSTERFEILKEASQSTSIEAVANAIHGQGNNTTVSAYSRQIKAFERDAKSLSDLLEQEAALWTETLISGAIDEASARPMARQIADQLASVQLDDQNSPNASGPEVEPTIQMLQETLEQIDRECLAAEGLLEGARQLEGEHRRTIADIAELGASRAATQARLNVLSGELEQARTLQSKRRKEVAARQDAMDDAANSILLLRNLRDARTLVAKLVAEHQASTAALTAAKQAKAAGERDVTLEEHKRQILHRLTGEIDQCDQEIDSLRDSISTVNEAIARKSRIREQSNTIAQLELANPDVEQAVHLAEVVATAASDSVSAHTTVIEGLRDSVDVMSKAIASIATHLPADTCDCPLCATHFDSASVLQARVATAAQRLAPTLAAQEEKLRNLSAARDARATELQRLRAAQKAIRSARAALDEEQEQQVRLLMLLDDGSSDQSASLTTRGARLADTIASVSAKRRRKTRWQAHPALARHSSGADHSSAVRVRDAAQRTLDAASRTSADLAAALEWAKSDEVNAISAVDVTSEISPDELSAVLQEKEAKSRGVQEEAATANLALADADGNVAALEAEQAGLRARLLERDSRKIELDDTIRRIHDDWLALRRFDRAPDITPVKAFERRIADSRLVMKKAAGQLTRLREGRLVWSRQLSHRAVVEQIREQVNEPPNKSREELLASATSRRAQMEAAAEAVRQVKEIAKAASADISAELEDFNSEYIKPLGYLMSQINQAILCDPRVGIDLHVKKKKIEQSAVKGNEVPKSVGAVDPVLVHSEGQMAALAVSMLSAASLTFPWSRWKGLVLDDPLQHNDSIHAAAFADLIGNLVTAEGYQVLLSTHDVAQAEFLQRKFRSRRIPCTTLNLLGLGKDGVEWSIQSSSLTGPHAASAR